MQKHENLRLHAHDAANVTVKFTTAYCKVNMVNNG